MNDCLFCKIVAGEIPAEKVYEDEYTLAFLDINPVNPGHTLVVPKTHATNIFDISAEAWGHVCETARRIAGSIEKAVGARGINLMMNNREHAGQVIDHVHIHLIPRHTGDGLRLWPQKPYPEGEAAQVAKRIRTLLEKSAQ
jgi:histidine triad (HIT) family protein